MQNTTVLHLLYLHVYYTSPIVSAMTKKLLYMYFTKTNYFPSQHETAHALYIQKQVSVYTDLIWSIRNTKHKTIDISTPLYKQQGKNREVLCKINHEASWFSCCDNLLFLATIL